MLIYIRALQLSSILCRQENLKRGRGVMGGNNRVSRGLLSAVLLVGFLWFLFAGVLVNQDKLTKVTDISGSSKLSKQRGKEWHVVSKRRVPNGPDPIHNRRAGSARQPPDRV